MSMRMRICTVLAGALAVSLGAVETLTFDQALALALQRNPDVAIARNAARIVDRNAHPGMAGLLPRVSLSGAASWQEAEGMDTTATSGQVQVAYTLFNGRGGILQLRQLRSDSRRAQLNTRAQIESILRQVAGTYYAAAAARENLEIAGELLEVSRQRLQRMQARARYGQSRTIDVLNARVDFSADRVTLQRAQFAWSAARRELNALLDRPLDTEFAVESTVELFALAPLEELKNQALAGNAVFLAAREGIRNARLDLGLARAARLPQLDLSAAYGFSRVVPGLDIRLDGTASSARVGLNLSFDLFNGHRNVIRVQTARLALENSELAARRARLDVENAVASAWESNRNSRRVLELETGSLEAAEVNFRRSRQLYRLGRLTATEFREAQLNLARARSAVSTARYDARLEEIRLLQLTGRLMIRVEELKS